MFESGLALALEFGNNALRQNFPQFNAPLIEWVNVPDDALSEDCVLIQGDKLSQCGRCETFRQDHVGRTVTCKDPMWRQPIRRAFSFDLFPRFSECQRLSLREDVCNKDVVMFA